MEAFRAVMSHGSVTRAAEAMNVTQPAVSRLISNLEASLGLQMFLRDQGRLRPTQEAHLLFQESIMAFNGLARLREAAMSLRGLQRGRVRIVSETVYAEGFLPRIVSAYCREHPDLHIEVDTGPSARIADWIAETWYDIGLVVLPVSQPDVAVHPLRRQHALCALPQNHRLAGRDCIDIADLANERFVAPVTNTPYRVMFDKAMKSARIEPDIRVEARTQHGICAFVASGAGVALVEPCAARDMRALDLAFVPVRPAVAWELAILQPKARPSSLLCNDFADYLVRNAETFI
jgi:DNA-binding transcriptional LysR family regulator